MSLEARYDAIVIGASVDGLVAATYLAKSGQRVLLLEASDSVGADSTEEIIPGFRAAGILGNPGWLPPRIARDLALEGHGLVRLDTDAGVLALTPGGGQLFVTRDVARSAEEIRRHSAADAGRWPAFVQRLARLSGFLEAVYAGPAPAIDTRSPSELLQALGLGRRLRGLGRTDMIELLRTIPMSVAELLDDWFDNDLLKGVVGGQGVTRICQGPMSGGTAFVLLHHSVGRPVGALRPATTVKGGTTALVAALAAAARQARVEIRTGIPVSRILMENGQAAAGVRTDSGQEVRAHSVLSSANPWHTFLALLDVTKVAPELVRAVRNIKMRGVTARVNLALDHLPTFAGVKDESHLRGAIAISPSLEYLERAYDDAKYGRVSRRPQLELRIPSLLDPSLAPAGKHVMTIDVQFAPYHLREGSWDAAARKALGDGVLDTLAEYAPGINEVVLGRQVTTPLDLEQRHDLPEGSLYHGEMTLDQILFMRPVAGSAKQRTPVEGLYLCGPGAHPGGGIAGGAGALAAREVMREMRRKPHPQPVSSSPRTSNLEART